MLRSPTASRATPQKRECIMTRLSLGPLLLRLREQKGDGVPSLTSVRKTGRHRNLRLFKA